MTDTVSPPAPLAGDTKRAYLVRIGLANPTRGKFSAVAHEALALHPAFVWADVVKVVPAPRTVVMAAPRSFTAAPVVSGVVTTADLPRHSAPTDGANPKDVRVWAHANGHTVGERGRIHASITAAYIAANGKSTAAPARVIVVEPKVRSANSGFVVERNTVLRFERCASSGGCGKAVSRCSCVAGPVAPHYLPAGIAGSLLSLDYPQA